jgi:hypothetical protein
VVTRRRPAGSLEANAPPHPASTQDPTPPGTVPPPPPPAPAQVSLRLASNPAGAMVTDGKTGVALGSTPLDKKLERGAAALELRIAKPGFTTAELSVPLSNDFATTVVLEPLPAARPAPAAPKRHPKPTSESVREW